MKILVQFVTSAVLGVAFFAVALFIPARTFDYWQAWVFIGLFSVTTLIPNIYLALRNPAALQRRMHAGPTAETRPVQRFAVTALFLSVPVTLVTSALDHRFGWSTVPQSVIVIGDILVVVGLGLAELVIVQNSYAAANVTVEIDQTLATTGPYGIVRHPMYSGVLIMMVGMPLALDSFWGLLPIPVALVALTIRILDEEKMLRTELAGYVEYAARVRHRLVPYLW